jgi:nitroimidazol reductase NimA-like FMN-containing flavoprotein (pyridoxamine 5'-phosphate oxidase superfamily)
MASKSFSPIQVRPDVPRPHQDALDRNGLAILSRSECLILLASRPVGRVGVSRHALPAILPVTYRLLGEDVIFATGTGSKSLAVADENVIAFEVDDVDPITHSGWSILVVGKARPVDERDPDWDAAHSLDLHPWVGHHAVQLIRLPTDRLTGRRLAVRRQDR